MAVQYGPPRKLTCFNGVKITSGEVSILQTSGEGWRTIFDKIPASVRDYILQLLCCSYIFIVFQIFKEEISPQEMYEISDLLEMDYPPKIEVEIQSLPCSPDSEPLHITIRGLDRESTYVLRPGMYVPFCTFYMCVMYVYKRR